MSRQRIKRKAAVDVSIIIAAFLLCFLPGWIEGIWRQFARSIKVPAQVVQVTSCILIVSSLCNPIIYSIRNSAPGLRRIDVFRSSNEIDDNVIALNNSRITNKLRCRKAFTTTLAAAQATQHHDERFCGETGRVRLNCPRNCLSSIPETGE